MTEKEYIKKVTESSNKKFIAFTIRIPIELKAKIEFKSFNNNLSQQKIIVEAIKENLK